MTINGIRIPAHSATNFAAHGGSQALSGGSTFYMEIADGSAIGSAFDDDFVVMEGFKTFDWSHFVVNGGGGEDVLYLDTSEEVDLRKFASFSGIEEVAFLKGGSLYMTSQHLAGLSYLWGSPDNTTIGQFVLSGSALSTFDLRGKTFGGNYVIEASALYSDIIVNNKSALLDPDWGARINFSERSGTRVHLVGDTFTAGERALLAQRGVDYIWDDSDSGAANRAPTISGLNGDTAATHGRDAVYLDTGGNAVVADDSRVRKVSVAVLNPTASDLIDIAFGAGLEFPDGIVEGGRIRDKTVFNGKVFAELYHVTNSSFDILFNGDSTPTYVNQVVRALIYQNTGTAASTHRQVQISVSDAADKTTTSTVTITHTSGVDAPPSGGVTRGTSESEVIRGSARADTIFGGAGADTIYGGAGKDTLRGDAGKDVFVFDTKPNRKQIDKIVKYNVKDDTIWLEHHAFSKIVKHWTHNTKLSSKAFYTGSAAHDSTDRIIYNKKTGAVYYDQDGSGHHSAVQFAKIDKHLKMTSADFWIV